MMSQALVCFIVPSVSRKMDIGCNRACIRCCCLDFVRIRAIWLTASIWWCTFSEMVRAASRRLLPLDGLATTFGAVSVCQNVGHHVELTLILTDMHCHSCTGCIFRKGEGFKMCWQVRVARRAVPTDSEAKAECDAWQTLFGTLQEPRCCWCSW